MGRAKRLLKISTHRRKLELQLPTGLARRRPRVYQEWKALKNWGKLPAWEATPPGYLLRELREEANLTQTAMSECLQCSQQAVAQAERWEANPTAKFMQLWATATGRDLEIRFRSRNRPVMTRPEKINNR